MTMDPGPCGLPPENVKALDGVTVILAFPSDTPQQRADEYLRIWQEQRKAGIKPEQRTLPDDGFNRDLEVIRQVMERS